MAGNDQWRRAAALSPLASAFSISAPCAAFPPSAPAAAAVTILDLPAPHNAHYSRPRWLTELHSCLPALSGALRASLFCTLLLTGGDDGDGGVIFGGVAETNHRNISYFSLLALLIER